MKTYYDLNEYHIKLGKRIILKKDDHWDYIQFLQELERGEAELVHYIPPAPTWEQIRAKRDALLKDSDWSAFPDANPKPSKDAWINYRQALRDLPQNFSTPEEVLFPNKPE